MSTSSKVEGFIDALRERILSGEFGNDGRLPSFRTLATEFGTTQETMNKTMQALQAEGLLISMGAKGVFVNKPRIRVPGMAANFYQEFLKKQNEPFQLSIEKPEIVTSSSQLAKRMNILRGSKVLKRIRKQGAGNIIYRVVEEYFPMTLITDEMLKQVAKDPHFHIIGAIKNSFGKTIDFIHEELTARLPTPFEQKELQIVRTNPVISTELTHFTKDKKTIITCNNKIMNANLFLLTFEYPVTYWK